MTTKSHFDLEDALRRQDTDVPEFVDQNLTEIHELLETGSAEFFIAGKKYLFTLEIKGV